MCKPNKILTQVAESQSAALCLICLWFWAPANARNGPLRDLQNLQHSLLCHACHGKSSVPFGVTLQELSVTWRHDASWHRVISCSISQADSASISNVVLHGVDERKAHAAKHMSRICLPLSSMVPLLLLRLGAGLAELHRFSDAC